MKASVQMQYYFVISRNVKGGQPAWAAAVADDAAFERRVRALGADRLPGEPLPERRKGSADDP